MELKEAILKAQKVKAKPGFMFYIVKEPKYEGYPGIVYQYTFSIRKNLEKRNWWQKLWGIKTIEIARNEDLNKLKEYIDFK